MNSQLIRFALLLACLASSSAFGQRPDSIVTTRNDSVSVRLVDTDLRSAVQALGRYLDRPLLIGAITGGKVTFETPTLIPRSDVPRILRGMLESQNLELIADTAAALYRIRPRTPAQTQGAARASGPSLASASGMELFVIRLRHARAADVAATVNALYGKAAAFGEPSAPPATLSRDLQQVQSASQTPSSGSPLSTSAPSVSPPNRAAALVGDVTIVPDPKANSLLVRASRNDYELIQAAVQQMDVRPLQVLIEVLIVELRRDRSLSFGTSATLPASAIRGTSTTVQGSTTGLGAGDFVLKIMGLGGVGVDATLVAAANRGDVTILSRPVIIAANNERAEINVGSQRPFVQVARVLPTDNTARDQVVQYKDVGTKLTVTPTISTEGYVMLQVTQEVNAATSEQQFNAPVISTRSVDTKLLVNDGQTIVLGGLSDRQREVTRSGVPFLSSLPLIGGLFGRSGNTRVETELFLFLTPHVIRADADADKLTALYSDSAKKVRP